MQTLLTVGKLLKTANWLKRDTPLTQRASIREKTLKAANGK